MEQKIGRIFESHANEYPRIQVKEHKMFVTFCFTSQ